MDAGIFITQIGVSVPTAADYQFVFNSNWPSLQCAFDTTVTINSSNYFSFIQIPHNLGFYPFTQAWLIDPSGNCLGRVGPGRNALDLSISIGKNTLYLFTSLLATGNYTLNIKCYNLDISVPANYTLPQFPTFKTPYDPSVGIKVTKFNKGITFTDLRDFILHSRAQSPAVLSIVTDAQGVASPTFTGYNQISYTNPANYTPWVYGFYSQPGSTGAGNPSEAIVYQQADYGVQSVGMSLTNITSNGGFTVTLPYLPSANQGASIVVMRDPLLVANTIEVQYNG